MELIDSDNLEKVVEDEFGNYVIQKSLKEFLPFDSELRATLIKKIIEKLPQFQNKKYLEKWGTQILEREIKNTTHPMKDELEGMRLEQMNQLGRMRTFSNRSDGRYPQRGGRRG